MLSAELAGTGSNGRAPSPWALHRRLLGDGGREGCPHPTHPEPNQGLLCPFPPDIGVERSTSWGLWGRMGPVPPHLPYAQGCVPTTDVLLVPGALLGQLLQAQGLFCISN